MILKDHLIMFIATGAWTGKIPVAPGTFGTLPGLLVCYGLSRLSWMAAGLCLAALIIAAVIVAGLAEKRMEVKDPGCIVIDEIAGMAVTLFALPFTAVTGVAGFLVFRFFDVIKPFPIRLVDRRVHGGIGIVADDLIAGLFANGVMQGLWYFVLRHWHDVG